MRRSSFKRSPCHVAGLVMISVKRVESGCGVCARGGSCD